jgi:diketogulonate reductase-like aldo/keto reductase
MCRLHSARPAAGYRMIDTAQVYGNEQEIGQAVRKSSIPREEVFIINKISSGFKKNPSSLKEASDSARASIDKLGLSYVDIFLIHQPGNDTDDSATGARRVTWQALEDLVEEGRVRSIGVSNYTADHILELKQFARIYPPKVNQLEVHGWKLVEKSKDKLTLVALKASSVVSATQT